VHAHQRDSLVLTEVTDKDTATGYTTHRMIKPINLHGIYGNAEQISNIYTRNDLELHKINVLGGVVKTFIHHTYYVYIVLRLRLNVDNELACQLLFPA